MGVRREVRTTGAWLALAVLAVLTSACGSGSGTATADAARNLVPEAYSGRYRALASVLESPEHGPQLCFGMAESFPPQCSGPDVAGWDWSGVTSESGAGTTWGSYELVGTFEDGTFTLTEPARDQGPLADGGSGAPLEDDSLATPCSEPPEGPPCASTTPRSEAELLAIQRTLLDLPGFVFSGPDPAQGVLDVAVVHGTVEQQRELDDEFGAGAVRLTSLLEPLDPS